MGEKNNGQKHSTLQQERVKVNIGDVRWQVTHQ
jgi:hypothetical protein